MSSTNKTTYYNLSQFANTDKPSWLNDYNNDMTIIDTNIKANANDIINNTNSIGDLTNLTTTNKTNLVNAINEVAGSSGGGGVQILDVTNNSSQNPVIFDNLDIGEYIIYFNNTTTFLSTKNVYFKNKSTDSSDDFCTLVSGSLLKVMKKSENMSNRYDYMGCIECFYVPNNYRLKYDIINIGITNSGNIEFQKRGNRYILNTTADVSANKMFRSDSNSNMYWADFNTIGGNYNSSAIQYLKNENGTLNWVSESNITPSMIYLGKINAYNSTTNALDLSSYPAGTRIVLKHNDSSRSFYLKVGSNTAQVNVSSDDNTAIVNNIYYVDVNSISGATASVSITWASTYEWCPLVTNNIMVNFTSGGASVGNTTRNMQVFPYFQIEEDLSGNLNVTTLQQFIYVREIGITKTNAQQRTAIQYVDKDKNNILLTYKSHISGSQQIYEGTGIMKVANASGLYECYRITLEINYSGLTYANYQVTKSRLGVVFDETAISGYSSTGTKTLSLNNGVLEWV